MAINRDFSDLFSAFAAAEARYLIVGAYAVIHYADPRYTKDLDVWVDPTEENALRVLAALKAFGAPVRDLSSADLCDPGLIFQLGVEPNRIDVLTAIDGVEFQPAWERSTIANYGDQPVRILGLADLIAAKRAAGRPQDLLDLERLERVRARRPKR